MFKYRNGFTLTEVTIAFIIVGIIFVLSFNSIRNSTTSYTALTYFAHKNILNMVGNLYSDITNNKLTYEDNILPSILTKCITEDGNTETVFKTDGELNSTVTNCSTRDLSLYGANLFCKSLVALSNIKGAYNCSILYSIDKTHNDPAILNISFDRPNFTLTNGMRFYISNWDYDSDVSSIYGYRLIAVDLNGKRRPNKAHSGSSTDKTPTDLVTFLVLDNGEVYPLGLAADNLEVSVSGKTLRYLNTKLKGYYFSDNNLRETMPKECKNGNKCNFGVVPIGNFNYRTAFCQAKKESGIGYIKYCSGITQNELCPPSNSNAKFNMCNIETIKPVFRYDF